MTADDQPVLGDDVRPREGERNFWDVTCGACGAEFGTNFRVEEIACPECEARRCPHCRHWFGAEEP
jgi:DNA-directed RNA polymerase subunit RPC12/RpoP